MLIRRIMFQLFSGALVYLVIHTSSVQAASPTASDMLNFKPQQANVNISTPSSNEISSCRVQLIKGNKLQSGRTASGWKLTDGRGKTLRIFFDTNGDNRIDIYSYFLEGKEVYREIDSNFDEKIDQYRWLGANGSKWGISNNQDGKIDTWNRISPEEVSQEILQAVIQRDFNRMNALMISKAELDSLGLPDSESNRIKNLMSQAPAKFQKTVAGLINLTPKTQWVHLETEAPECTPADNLGSRQDLVRYSHGAILYQSEKADWLQTGEMIKVGQAWRIIDAPVPGSGRGNAESSPLDTMPEIAKKLVEVQLKSIDEMAPKTSSDPKAVIKYNLDRAAILEQIIAQLQGEQRDVWLRQLVDCLSTAAQSNPKDRAPYERLLTWEKQIAKENPGSSSAAYATYREMSADYAMRLSGETSSEMTKIQESWRERLAKFVQDYATSEDAPEALLQLGMVNEFIGKETDAKNWYKQLAKHFRNHPYAAKAIGAERRLSLEGQEFELSGSTLGTENPFDIKSLKGKTVIVYYWASWNAQCAEDFKKLKVILAGQPQGSVEMVLVNLDNSAGDAINFLRSSPIQGTHLYQKGGLDSPLAIAYGIMVLPNMFIINGEGKVISRNGQVATLEDELKRLNKENKENKEIKK